MMIFTVNVIGSIVLYPEGVVVSVKIYSPSSNPLNVKVVPLLDFTTVIFCVDPSFNFLARVNSAPGNGCLVALILLTIA